MASLPGKLMVYDDDLDAVTTLPDGVLKKLSERKKLEANPKNKAPFSFVSVATPILLANKFPSIRDVSNGTRRRAQLIPFNRTFSAEEMDLQLANRLKTDELPGILNRALEGLKRVRQRGRFKTPDECVILASLWMASSNALAGFIDEQVMVTGDDADTETLKDLYDAFRLFCARNGITFVASRYNLSENLQNFGIKLGPKGKNIVRFKGLKLMKDEDADDL
jgi:putative DNA primase/helicase